MSRVLIEGVPFSILYAMQQELEFELPSLEKRRELAKDLWAIIDTLEANRTLINATDELMKSQFIETVAHKDFFVHATLIRRCA